MTVKINHFTLNMDARRAEFFKDLSNGLPEEAVRKYLNSCKEAMTPELFKLQVAGEIKACEMTKAEMQMSLYRSDEIIKIIQEYM